MLCPSDFCSNSHKRRNCFTTFLGAICVTDSRLSLYLFAHSTGCSSNPGWELQATKATGLTAPGDQDLILEVPMMTDGRLRTFEVTSMIHEHGLSYLSPTDIKGLGQPHTACDGWTAECYKGDLIAKAEPCEGMPEILFLLIVSA